MNKQKKFSKIWYAMNWILIISPVLVILWAVPRFIRGEYIIVHPVAFVAPWFFMIVSAMELMDRMTKINKEIEEEEKE